MNAGICCWLLLLIAAVDCFCWLLLLIVAAGCRCWLLLLVDVAGCCCWLLLLVAAAGCCCWLLGDCRLLRLTAGWLLVAAGMRLAGGKVFVYFRNIDDLRLRQFCRRKSRWIFSSRWWGKLAKARFKIVLEYFQIGGWIPELWWEERGREFRLGELG